MASTQEFTPNNKAIVRLVVISDTHGRHHHLTPMMPDGDMLIHLGDFCNKGSEDDAIDFAKWITNQANTKYPEVFVIDGNHDRTLERNLEDDAEALDLQDLFSTATLATDGRLQFLQDDFVTSKHHRLRLFGASWESCHSGNFPEHFRWGNPDVMLAHINPYIPNYVKLDDKVKGGWRGRRELFTTIQQNKIPLCLTGHVHWSRGVVPYPTDNRGNSIMFVNAATLKSQRGGIVRMNTPVVIDYDVDRKQAIRIDCPVLL